MKKTFLVFTLLVALIGVSYALTAGDIAIIAVNTDDPDAVTGVALVDIPEGTVITITDNSWDATNQVWRTGEGSGQWTCPTGGITKGTVFALPVGSILLSASGDQILAYEGTTAPTSNTDATWLYGFSTENWAFLNNTTSSDIPTALSAYSVALTTSTTEYDNAYFANGSSAQTAVTVSGTKENLISLFTNSSLYYVNNTGPLTFPAYTITVTTGSTNQPPLISNIVHTPSTDIINTSTVSVSATITDSDGTVTSAQLRWGTTSGTYGNTIGMTASGSTYTTNSNIPAQITGTTVYYVIDATDDDSDTTTSSEQSYTVIAPATATIPYDETFDADLGDCYSYTVSGIKPWDYSSQSATVNAYQGSFPEEHWFVLPGINFNSYSNERMTFTNYVRYGTIDAANYLKLFYSTDYPGLGTPVGYTWTEVTFTQPTTGTVGSTELSATSGVLDLSSISGASVFLAFKYYAGDNPSQWRVDDINIYLATPVITVNPSTLTGFTYEYLLGPSPEQTFTVSGADLSDDISIIAPTNYEVSTTTGANFGPSLTLTAAKLDVNTTTIYVRLKAGLAIGIYNSEDITITSSGATNQTVTCSGEVTSPPAPGEPVAGTATNVAEGSFTATWEAVAGVTGYYLDVYTKETGALASDLFFSEYIEGSSNNKALEIFNGTGAAVDLANYRVDLYSAPNTTPGNTLTFAAGTYLADGDVYVIANSSANSTILALADVTSTVTYFNGDDTLILVKIIGETEQFVDVFGCIGEDPGTAWGTAPVRTAEQTLVRKNTVTGGVTANPSSGFPTLATEWDGFAQDTTDYLGSHTMAGGTNITYVTGYENLNVGNVTSYSVTGLDPGTTYYYVVRAYNDYGTSGNSNEQSVLTEENTNPVELASFTATISAQNYITLTWVTQTETGMRGYYIYRDTDNNFAGAQNVSPLIPSANSSQTQTYMFEDTEVYDTGTYFYWLQTNDMDGTVAFHGPVSVFYNALGDNPTPEIPLVTELHAVYPNPFNPLAFIPFSLAQDSNVSFKIYNARGQIVKHYELGNKAAGNYRITWDGTDYHGDTLSNGVYQIVMTAGSQVYQTKTTLLK